MLLSSGANLQHALSLTFLEKVSTLTRAVFCLSRRLDVCVYVGSHVRFVNKAQQYSLDIFLRLPLDLGSPLTHVADSCGLNELC